MSSRKRGPRPVEMGLAAVVAIVLAVNPDARGRIRRAPAQAVGVRSSLSRPLPRRLGPGERPGEAQFMAVRVGQVEETLAPGGIRRGSVGLQSRGHGTGVEGVHVGDV